ncbi:MAG: hypothetical protein QXL49_06200, partial [Acidilobaceae archaeon]
LRGLFMSYTSMGLDYVTISLLFHSSYKYKIVILRSSIIERIVWKVQLYGLKTVYVELRGATSSREHRSYEEPEIG